MDNFKSKRLPTPDLQHAALNEEWAKNNSARKLVKSMQKRLKAVIEQKGCHT